MAQKDLLGLERTDLCAGLVVANAGALAMGRVLNVGEDVRDRDRR